jgi:hypothetical protein
VRAARLENAERYTRSVTERRSSERAVSHRESRGRPTGDPVDAASGERVELQDHGRRAPRLRLFLAREELPWLPVSEPAFLLWVLVLLVFVWLGIAAYVSLA